MGKKPAAKGKTAPARGKKAAPAAPAKRAATAGKFDLPIPPKRAPKGPPPSLLASVRTAAPGVSRQRPYRLGGTGTSKFIGGAALERDDGLTVSERNLIERGESKALTGAAKIRYFYQDESKRVDISANDEKEVDNRFSAGSSGY